MQTHEVKHFNWLHQRWFRDWCTRHVGLRYFDAPSPMEMRCYSQFTWRWVTINARRCFSVCFTVMRNLLVMERRYICLSLSVQS